MARKTTTKSETKTTTAVRNTAIPKKVAPTPAKPEATFEAIQFRAYEIYTSGQGGGQLDHWLQAERELRTV